MNALQTVMSEPWVVRLGWSLIHFLWQGAAIALLLFAVLKLLRNQSAALRYIASYVALLMMAVSISATICLVPNARSVAESELALRPIPGESRSTANPAEIERLSAELDNRSGQPFREATQPDNNPSPQQSVEKMPPAVMSVEKIILAENDNGKSRIAPLAHRLRPLLPQIVFVWLLGIVLLSLWHLSGWLQLQRLRRMGLGPLPQEIVNLFQHLTERMQVGRAVRLFQSTQVTVPSLIGAIKPVILLPVGVLTGLSRQQLEAILAHELAHIRRHDYLLNLLQTVLETLLFYHPAVWWVGRTIRRERENCCDDVAIRVCGDRLGYARALAELAELRASSHLAMAASSNRGVLFARIQRVLGLGITPQAGRTWASAALIVLLGMAAVIGCLKLNAEEKEKSQISSAKIEYYYSPTGQWIAKQNRTLKDAKTIEKLASFFPHMGEGRESDSAAGWEAKAIIHFQTSDGKKIRISTDYDAWSEGKGDWDFKNSKKLVIFINKLFPTEKENEKQTRKHIESVVWINTGRHHRTTLKLKSDYTYELKETQRYEKEITTTRKGKWSVLSQPLALIALDGKHLIGKHGVRIFQTNADITKGRYRRVALRHQEFRADDRPAEWLEVAKGWRASLSHLAKHTSEVMVVPLPKPKVKSVDLERLTVPVSIQRQVSPLIQGGWRMEVLGNAVLVTRNKQAETYGTINLPVNSGVEDLRKMNMTIDQRYVVTLRVGPKVSLEDYRKKKVENAETYKQLASLREKMGEISHKFDSYLPSTLEERKLVEQYEKLKKSRHDLPDGYTETHSIWIGESVGWTEAFAEEAVGKECRRVRDKIVALFQKCEPGKKYANDRQAVVPIDLGKKRVRLEKQPADKNPSGLFAIGSYIHKRLPTENDVYGWRLNGKISDGSYQLVGRLPGTFSKGDRFEVERFERRGGVITIFVKHHTSVTEVYRPLQHESVDLIADLPNRLPAGKYVAHVRINDSAEKRKPFLSCLIQISNAGVSAELKQLAETAIAMKLATERRGKTDQNPTGLNLLRLVEPSIGTAYRHITGLDNSNGDRKIEAARALLKLADPNTVAALLAAAKSNNYFIEGSENATIHSIYRRTLKQALEKITGLALTPKGLKVTITGPDGKPRIVLSEDAPKHFAERVDYRKVEDWLRVVYLAAGSEGGAASKILKQVKAPKDRGTLRDAYQKEAGLRRATKRDKLQHAPPIAGKAKEASLEAWFESLKESDFQLTTNDDNWLLFRSKQVNGNDRMWIEHRGNAFTITMNRAIWIKQRYRWNVRYHAIHGVNLGKLPAGKYTAKWVINRTSFKAFKRGYPEDLKPTNEKPVELETTFTVLAAKAQAGAAQPALTLAKLASAADRIVVATTPWQGEQFKGQINLQATKSFKGTHGIGIGSERVHKIEGMQQLPADASKQWIFFLQSQEEGDPLPQPYPATAKGWFMLYSDQLADKIRAAIALPKEWSEINHGLRIGLRLPAPRAAIGDDFRLEVCIQNAGRTPIRLWQHCYNIYDYGDRRAKRTHFGGSIMSRGRLRQIIHSPMVESRTAKKPSSTPLATRTATDHFRVLALR